MAYLELDLFGLQVEAHHRVVALRVDQRLVSAEVERPSREEGVHALVDREVLQEVLRPLLSLGVRLLEVHLVVRKFLALRLPVDLVCGQLLLLRFGFELFGRSRLLRVFFLRLYHRSSPALLQSEQLFSQQLLTVSVCFAVTVHTKLKGEKSSVI